jgi:signal transduction histidine kinase
MILILLLLIISQLIWLQQQMEKEKATFQLKLENCLESMINFHALRGYTTFDPKNPNKATIILEDTNFEELDKDSSRQLSSIEMNTDMYTPNFSLHKALEEAFIDISLERKKLQLSAVDSLFQHNFAELTFISNYNMELSENGKPIDIVYSIKDTALKPSKNILTITIPLGTKETYVFTANFQLRTLPFLRLMLYSISISGIAVIFVALFMLWLLIKLHQKVNDLQWREQAVSGIVHDLKSPVSFTYTFLDYLGSTEQSASMQYQLNNASTNISKLSDKIELILTLFRSKRTEIVMAPKTFPLSKKCNELLSELNIIYPEKQAKCNVSIPENFNLLVDPLYFEMALRNLIDNAFKYSTPPVKIDISRKIDKKRFHIYIKDSGNGIPKSEQKKIFSEFYRSDNITKGYGIGLSFSKQVIKAHKGKISLQSKIDKGSTFCISLPTESMSNY